MNYHSFYNQIREQLHFNLKEAFTGTAVTFDYTNRKYYTFDVNTLISSVLLQYDKAVMKIGFELLEKALKEKGK